MWATITIYSNAGKCPMRANVTSFKNADKCHNGNRHAGKLHAGKYHRTKRSLAQPCDSKHPRARGNIHNAEAMSGRELQTNALAYYGVLEHRDSQHFIFFVTFEPTL
jgi:hypothetical protein